METNQSEIHDTAQPLPGSIDVRQATRVFDALSKGRQVFDREFDKIYPEAVRTASRLHWTPVQVARRAVQLLVNRPGLRVLDVGSAAGKFCFVGALTSEAEFTGIEQRSYLVELACDLSRLCYVPRVRFESQNLLETDWHAFDAIYLYNPFGENFHRQTRIDDTVTLSRSAFEKYVSHTETQLAQMARGTRVLHYHGFGGEMPVDYRLEHSELCGSGKVELFIKQ